MKTKGQPAHWLLLLLAAAVLMVMVSENKRQDNLVADYVRALAAGQQVQAENQMLRLIIEAQQERIQQLERYAPPFQALRCEREEL